VFFPFLNSMIDIIGLPATPFASYHYSKLRLLHFYVLIEVLGKL